MCFRKSIFLLVSENIRSLGSSVHRGKLPLGSHLLDIAEFIELLKFWYSDFGMDFVNRWVVERTNSWHNAHKKLLWCTERQGQVIDFWVTFSDVVIIVRRLIREAWSRYRWEPRPSRRP